MGKWQLRRAITSDVDALTSCIDAAYAVYADRVNDLPPVSEGIADDIATNRVWVAEIKNSVVGGLILVPKLDFLIVANIAVDPAYAGIGIGRALMELADIEGRTLELSELRLSTHIDMPENVTLYRHLGWAETGRSGNKVHMKKMI